MQKVAAWAAQVGLQVDQIRHSGKLRAQQAAEILAERLQPRQGVTSETGLGPNDNVLPVADALADLSGSVMLVGHLPFLSRLAGVMLSGDPGRRPVRFRNGGLVGMMLAPSTAMPEAERVPPLGLTASMASSMELPAPVGSMSMLLAIGPGSAFLPPVVANSLSSISSLDPRPTMITSAQTITRMTTMPIFASRFICIPSQNNAPQVSVDHPRDPY